jgi:hypothetical protein
MTNEVDAHEIRNQCPKRRRRMTTKKLGRWKRR